VLTGKEREVLAAVGAGLANSEFADRLYLSEATVKSHVSRILAKLQLTNRVQAAILAHHAGLA
jgi:DNA-binding NarL/FixJ family response regulator